VAECPSSTLHLGAFEVILSDRSLREAIDAGRLVVDPLDDDAIQPSSIDVRLDNRFRTFYTARHPYIDVKQPMDDLTELVEVKPDEAFILHPGEFVLGSSLERIGIPPDLAARLEGKALAVDTPIPTPSGWVTMAGLRPGDQVFDENGLPCTILAATDAQLGRPCREVVFSDGNRVVADLQHRWLTSDKTAREHHPGRYRLVTTAEVAAKLRVRDEFNHHVALAGAVRYGQQELPIDPYVLGVWLGDGSASMAVITCADDEILREIEKAGYRVAPPYRRIHYRIGGTGHTRDPRTGRYSQNGSFSSSLRRLDLLHNKHVPPAYLIAAVDQRTALLQGLMDSDGHVDAYGRCEFSSVLEQLADSVVELAASLGLRPVKTKDRATLYGVDCGPRYRVRFTPDRPVFRLPRKLARQRLQRPHHRFRAIVDVREVESRPVRCIQVSSPSGLFLAGRGFIPTHNSSLGRLGLMTHSTAGFLDPGFQGHVTLELSNVANLPITLYPGMRIGQIAVFQLTTPAERPYGSRGVRSKYQGQRGPTPSRYWENFRSS
jgi:deoxycytidine triphosphate deaminase